jgi:hypothetical protein
MFSLGIFSLLAAATAVLSLGLASMSPPPMRAATVISLISLVKILPLFASVAAFLCLMLDHLLCPDMCTSCLNSELLMCRKIGSSRNIRNRVNKTEFGRIVLNLIFYFASITKIKIADITLFQVIVPFIF